MPIIIDNSLLQPEEPQDDSAFGYAMMGLVEGVGAGIDKQRAQQEELAQFNREKDFELEKLRKEQEFNAPLQAAKVEEAKTATAANRVALDAATLEAEAARRAAAAKQAREDAANRSRWAEAFGDGDVAKGESMLQDFDRRAAEAEAAGGREAGDRVRFELQRIGEEKHAIRQARKANEYIGSVLTSDIFKNDERLRLRADQILNDPKLGPVEKQSAVEGLVAEGKRKGAVARKKNNIIARVSEREKVLQAKMDAETDPEIDAMYRAQIDDLHDYASEWDSIGEDDEEGAARLFENGSAMLRGSPSDAFYRRNGGRGAVEARSNSAAAFNDEMNFLKGLADSGAFTEEQLKPLWQNLLARRVGNMAASGQLPGASVNMNLGKTIMDDLMGNKKKDGDTPPTPEYPAYRPNEAVDLVARFDDLVAKEDHLSDLASNGTATEEELDELARVRGKKDALKNEAAVKIRGFKPGFASSEIDYFFRQQLMNNVEAEGPVAALEAKAVDPSFGGYFSTDPVDAAILQSDLRGLSSQEISRIRIPRSKDEFDKLQTMLKTGRSKIVLDDLNRIGAERGFYKPTASETSKWSSKSSGVTAEQGVAAIARGVESEGEISYKGLTLSETDLTPEMRAQNRYGWGLTDAESKAATEALYSKMGKKGIKYTPSIDPDVSNQVREQELKAQAAESRRSASGAPDDQTAASMRRQKAISRAAEKKSAESDQVRNAVRTLMAAGFEVIGPKRPVAPSESRSAIEELKKQTKGPRTTKGKDQ